MQEVGAKVVEFTMNKNCRKWVQILLRYLRDVKQFERMLCFAGQDTVIFGLESKGKNNRILINIGTASLTSYNMDITKANQKINGQRGFLFAIDIQLFKMFLSSWESDLQIKVSGSQFSAKSTLDQFSLSFSCHLMEIDEIGDIFQSIQLKNSCNLSLSHQTNAILQEVEPIIQTFNTKYMSVSFRAIEKTLEIRLDNNTLVSSVVQDFNGSIKPQKRFDASVFGLGLSNLQISEKLELSLGDQVALFRYQINSNLVLEFYLSQLAQIEDN